MPNNHYEEDGSVFRIPTGNELSFWLRPAGRSGVFRLATPLLRLVNTQSVGEEYYVVPLNAVPCISMEDTLLHMETHPFCPAGYGDDCPCHEDPVLIAEVAQLVQDGLFTADEAMDFVAGRFPGEGQRR